MRFLTLFFNEISWNIKLNLRHNVIVQIWTCSVFELCEFCKLKLSLWFDFVYRLEYFCIYCSVLKYEFCIRYNLSIGLAIVPGGGRFSCAAWGWPPCKSRFCNDSVSDVPSSRWSKFVLSSKEISLLQKLSPECAGYASEKQKY